MSRKKISAFPISVALRKTLSGYNFSKFRHDVMSAFVVSLVALPLSMALAIAVGLPPQHGIYTAIIAGIIVPMLGGSVWQVSGPTAAFVVILAPIVSEHGLRGIIWAGFMAGLILCAMGFARLGRFINYVPYPVTTGFTAGIAVVLATLSLNDFLGLGIEKLDGTYLDKAMTIVSNFGKIDFHALIIGATTLALLFTAGKVVKFLPSAVIAMLAAIILAVVFSGMGHEVATIGSEFSYVALDGKNTQGVPPYPPALHLPEFSGDSLFAFPGLSEFRELLFPAFAIAILAALESLLSATVADSMTGTRHDPNAELTAIGVGNVFSAMAAGIPATGAIARTATLINSGAKTPLASGMHALFIMAYVLLLAPYISYVPMAALAALLIHTAYRMSHYRQFMRIIEIAPRSDVIVLLTCFALTVFVDMVVGVGVGMVCAAFLLIRTVSGMTEAGVQKKYGRNGGVPRNIPRGTLVYRIRGPLFFGTIEKAFDRNSFTYDDVKHFVVDISDVPFIDMSGLVAMKSMLESIARDGRVVHIVCNRAAVAKKIRKKISDHYIRQHVYFHRTLDEAIVVK